MRNKTANELLKIVRMLFSEDEEIVRLGIGLFQDCYLLTNIGKHQKFTFVYEWLGFISDKSGHFCSVPSSGSKETFTKGQFTKMLNSNKVPTFVKAYRILCFINMLTIRRIKKAKKIKNRDYNWNLCQSLRSADRANQNIIPPYSYCYSKIDYYMRTDKENFLKAKSITNFREELEELHIQNIPRDFYDANLQHHMDLFKRFNKHNKNYL